MQVKPGDIVRFLNSTGGGRVTRVEGRLAYVDDDGFETPTLVSECVVVAEGNSFYESKLPKAIADFQAQETRQQAQVSANTPKVTETIPTPALEPIEETPEGEKLNIVLGFDPTDIKRLSTSSFDVFLVNDSNYWLNVMIASRDTDTDEWTLRFAGIVEPAIQEFVFELPNDELTKFNRLAVQVSAFKRGKSFSLKKSFSYESRFDNTKLARLHCFGKGTYFESDVVSVDIIRDDIIASVPKIDSKELEKALQEKKDNDRRKSRPVKAKKHTGPTVELLEVDLHASELLETTTGLSPADILNYQIDTFRKIMDSNLRNIGRPIVFIHGKGEGVLRSALMKELTHRYKGHDVSDASFREYGYGATKVIIRNTKS